MDYQKVGLLISTLRKEKGLTQKELADKLGITDRAVSKWERGLGCPDVSLLDDLSIILDISILEILKGRRLDKDEIVNNKSVVESMNYSKESMKYRIKRIFNIVSITLVSIICLTLLLGNLKSIYYLNKTYYNNAYRQRDEKMFSNVANNIAIIKNNQGIYSDENYDKILAFITELEKNLESQNNLYYFSKANYKYADMAKFYKSHLQYIYPDGYFNLTSGIYKMLYEYSHDVVDNMIVYYVTTESLMTDSFNLSQELVNPYYNNKDVNINIVGERITSFIYTEYDRDNMLLKDIIEVGEMHE